MRSYMYDVVLVCIGIAGFLLARYIYNFKHRKQTLVCPLRSNCDTVITSRYSKFLGVPLEILGMTYYGLVALTHISMLVFPALATNGELWVGLIASTGAFLFSLYLISIQAFVLKQWCTWCLCSATFCVLIFIATYLSSPTGLF